MSVIPTIAPFLLPRILPRLRGAPATEAVPARGAQRRGDRIASPWARRLRAARPPSPTGEVELEMLGRGPALRRLSRRTTRAIRPPKSCRRSIDEGRLLLLEDGHCLKDHALAACNRPELRASATMIGTSLHTLVQMVDNGLGVTMLPQMAIDAGILRDTHVVARPLKSANAFREIALVWRKNSPRSDEFRLLAGDCTPVRPRRKIMVCWGQQLCFT